MRHSRFNNPLVAQGLSGLIQQVIGNPGTTAQNALTAAQARNENMTAQFRDAMGIGITPGMSPLSQMMIRALQAGSSFSGNAVGIAKGVNQQEDGHLGQGGHGGAIPDWLIQEMIGENDEFNTDFGAMIQAAAKSYGFQPQALLNALRAAKGNF